MTLVLFLRAGKSEFIRMEGSSSSTTTQGEPHSDCSLSIVPAIFDLLTIDKHTHRLTQWEDPRISNPQIAGQVHQ